MLPLSTVFLFTLLAMASSYRYSQGQRGELTTGERFVNNVQMVAHDLKESGMLKKKAVIDAVRAMAMVKYGVLRHLKKTDNKALNTLVDIELAKLEAVKAVMLASLNMLSTQIDSLMDEIQSHDVTDLLQSPVFDFVAELMAPLLSGVNDEQIKYKMVAKHDFPSDSLRSGDNGSRENLRHGPSKIYHSSKKFQVTILSVTSRHLCRTTDDLSVYINDQGYREINLNFVAKLSLLTPFNLVSSFVYTFCLSKKQQVFFCFEGKQLKYAALTRCSMDKQHKICKIKIKIKLYCACFLIIFK